MEGGGGYSPEAQHSPEKPGEYRIDYKSLIQTIQSYEAEFGNAKDLPRALAERINEAFGRSLDPEIPLLRLQLRHFDRDYLTKHPDVEIAAKKLPDRFRATYNRLLVSVADKRDPVTKEHSSYTVDSFRDAATSELKHMGVGEKIDFFRTAFAAKPSLSPIEDTPLGY